MAEVAVPSRPAFGARALVVIRLAAGLGLLTGAVVALYFSTQNELLKSYNAAPACAALANAVAGKDCRYTAMVTVTQLLGDDQGPSVYLDVQGPYTPFFVARLPKETQLDPRLVPGSPVQVELWRLRVTKFDGAITADNPALDPRPGNLLMIGLLLLPLGLGATGWAFLDARRSRRAQDQATAMPTMSPVAFSDVLWR